jgi:hypothetical protein
VEDNVERQITELASVLARVQKLEAENHRLKRIFVAALVLVGAALLMAQARSNRVVEAEKFILKDASGNARARLEMEAFDRPTLIMLDQKGFPVATLGGGQGPFLTLCTAGCEHQVQISASKDVFGMTLFGKDQPGIASHGLRAAFGVYKEIPGVTLYSDRGTEQVGLDIDRSEPKLVLRDASGAARTLVGNANIVLSRPDGKLLWSAP